MSVPFLMTSPPRLVGPVWEPDGPVRGPPRTIAELVARLEADGTLTPAALLPDAAAATPPSREAYGPPQASDIVPGHQRLKYAGLAAWERGRTEIRERNAALLAQSVAEQKAAIAAARAPGMQVAKAELVTQLAAVAEHRAKARQWAKDNPDAAERLAETQARARAKSAEIDDA